MKIDRYEIIPDTPSESEVKRPASLVARAVFVAGILGALAWPTVAEASVQRKEPLSASASNPKLGVELSGFFGQYGPQMTKSYLALQAEERKARKNGAWMEGRKVVFEGLRNPNNLLSLFFNDADLLKETLGKTMKEVSGFERLDDANVEEAVSHIFSSAQQDRAWLRQTVNGKKVPLGDTEFAKYSREVDGARAMLFLRLQDSRFRAYVIERFNAFLPKLAEKRAIGHKTLQTVLTGIAAMSDASENAEHVVRTGKQLSQNPMAQFDQASQIARLVSLVSQGGDVVRVHIGVPNSENSLVYFVAQSRQTTPAFGDTFGAYGVVPTAVMNELIRWMKRAVESAWQSRK